LLVRGPGILSGRVVDDFVNVMDLAPTFLEVGGVKPPEVMTGRSLMNVLRSKESGQVDASRTWVVTGRERHVAEARAGRLPYPHRAIRTAEFLYIRNFAPDRWPMGAPRFEEAGEAPPVRELERNTFAAFADMDASPTKAWLIGQRHSAAWRWHYDRAFAKRPAEELYDLRRDPDQVRNIADDPAYADRKRALSDQLLRLLRDTGDPRVSDDPAFDGPAFTEQLNW